MNKRNIRRFDEIVCVCVFKKERGEQGDRVTSDCVQMCKLLEETYDKQSFIAIAIAAAQPTDQRKLVYSFRIFRSAPDLTFEICLVYVGKMSSS